jgi:hypothetical protein
MNAKRLTIATFAAGLLLGGGSAFAAVTYTEPEEPTWMQTPCDPSGLNNSSCYFEHNWVRTFPHQNIACKLGEKGTSRKVDYCFQVDESRPLGAPMNTKRWIANH